MKKKRTVFNKEFKEWWYLSPLTAVKPLTL